MFEVTLTDKLDFAKLRYNRFNSAELLELSVQDENSKHSHQLSIPQAEHLIKKLQDAIHEIKD